MNYAAAILMTAAASASADTSMTYTPSGLAWTLVVGTQQSQPLASESLCKSAALAKAEVEKKTVDFYCSATWGVGKVTYTPPPPPGLIVNPSSIPPADPGFGISFFAYGRTYQSIEPTTELPSDSDGRGQFRTACKFTQYSYDDPLVFPGQPGRSHGHAFFGNPTTNANSTTQSLLATSTTNCAGGPQANKSAYWIPGLIDTATGNLVLPKILGIYYKASYSLDASTVYNPIPQGFRFLIGDSKAAAPQAVADWTCEGDGKGAYKALPNCAVGTTLRMNVTGPACWDGVNLTSPDNRSHTAYPSGGKCPATHPKAIPEISFHAEWDVKTVNQTASYRLVSDPPTGPAGYTIHGDEWLLWAPDVMASFVQNCLNAKKDCHGHLVGDGRQLNMKP